MKLCTVKTKGKYFTDHLFENVINKLQINKKNFKEINLDKYIEYGYMSINDEIICMCGITDFGLKCYRVESACWINPKYRNSYFKKDNIYNHYKLSNYQMSKYDANLWFKSRVAKNPAGISKVIPEGWKVYPTQIELCWKNNWQWIVYKGDIDDYLENLQTPNINTYRTF